MLHTAAVGGRTPEPDRLRPIVRAFLPFFPILLLPSFLPSPPAEVLAVWRGGHSIVADAAMIDSVIGLDVRRDDERAVPGARMGRGRGRVCVWGGEPAPGQREVEGRGGAFWYEVPH